MVAESCGEAQFNHIEECMWGDERVIGLVLLVGAKLGDARAIYRGWVHRRGFQPGVIWSVSAECNVEV